MTHTAIETLSTFGIGVLCAVLGIIALAIFFTVLNRFEGRGVKPDTISVRGVLKKDTVATVYLAGTEKYENVRFVGFTNAESFKTHLPHDLNGMVILEDEDKRRFLIRAKAIRLIVIEPVNEEAGLSSTDSLPVA